MVKEREATEKASKCRARAVKAAKEGFPIPIRTTGLISCDTRDDVPECLPLEGELGISALEVLIYSDWHPAKVTMQDGEPVETMNAEDEMIQRMEAEYPGEGVAEFVYGCWAENKAFNPSGGYSVEVPWHKREQRELRRRPG